GPHGRGPRGRPRGCSPPRGSAPGVPALCPPGGEHPRSRRAGRRHGRGRHVARPAVRRAGAPMTFIVLFWLNVLLVGVFAIILMRPQLLGFAKGGKWYLTWLSIGVITLMDELTSVFYAPAEAHRFIGMTAIFFIAFTSLLMRVLSTRMVEISEILELHGLRGRVLRPCEPERARRTVHGAVVAGEDVAERRGGLSGAAPSHPGACRVGHHDRRGELRARLLRHRIGHPDRRPGGELAGHRQG